MPAAAGTARPGRLPLGRRQKRRQPGEQRRPRLQVPRLQQVRHRWRLRFAEADTPSRQRRRLAVGPVCTPKKQTAAGWRRRPLLGPQLLAELLEQLLLLSEAQRREALDMQPQQQQVQRPLLQQPRLQGKGQPLQGVEEVPVCMPARQQGQRGVPELGAREDAGQGTQKSCLRPYFQLAVLCKSKTSKVSQQLGGEGSLADQIKKGFGLSDKGGQEGGLG